MHSTTIPIPDPFHGLGVNAAAGPMQRRRADGIASGRLATLTI